MLMRLRDNFKILCNCLIWSCLIYCPTDGFAQEVPKIVIEHFSQCHQETATKGITLSSTSISISQDDNDINYADKTLLSSFNKADLIELKYLIVSNCTDTIFISNCLSNDSLNLLARYDPSADANCSNIYVLSVSYTVPLGSYYTYLFNSVDLSNRYAESRESSSTDRDEFGNIVRVRHYIDGNLNFEELCTYGINQNLQTKTEMNGDGVILRVFEYSANGKLENVIHYLDGQPNRTDL